MKSSSCCSDDCMPLCHFLRGKRFLCRRNRTFVTAFQTGVSFSTSVSAPFDLRAPSSPAHTPPFGISPNRVLHAPPAVPRARPCGRWLSQCRHRAAAISAALNSPPVVIHCRCDFLNRAARELTRLPFQIAFRSRSQNNRVQPAAPWPAGECSRARPSHDELRKPQSRVPFMDRDDHPDKARSARLSQRRSCSCRWPICRAPPQ